MRIFAYILTEQGKNGEKVAIPSLDSLKRHGQSLKDLLKVSDDDLDDIHKGGEQD